jgi:hypothetical protein
MRARLTGGVIGVEDTRRVAPVDLFLSGHACFAAFDGEKSYSQRLG